MIGRFLVARGKNNGSGTQTIKKYVPGPILLLVRTNSLPTIPAPVNIRLSGDSTNTRAGPPIKRPKVLYAGNVDDDHVAGAVIVLVLSSQVGGVERSVELSCHDDFVC